MEMGQPDVLVPARRRHVYVVVDPDGDLVPGTRATWMFGGQPTVWMVKNGWHYKFTAVHEYGHVLALLLGVWGNAAHIDYEFNNEPSHGWDSIEWSAAAANEGFAHFYMMATWHDVTGSTPPFRFPFPQPAGNLIFKDIPLATPRCQVAMCGAGTSNEGDWVGALIEFARDSTAPSLAHVLGMNAAAHDHTCLPLGQAACGSEPTCTWSTHAFDQCVGWPVNGATSDYWDHFDAAMQVYLTTAEYQAWETIADDHVIAQ